MLSSSDIQYPQIRGEKKFQSFCLKLIRRVWNDAYAQTHARQGQEQHGADITGSDYVNSLNNAAVQCKGTESNKLRVLSTSDIDSEVNKAKFFSPKLDLLIIAYSGERDGKLQRHVSALNLDHHEKSLFKVVLWAWDDIIEQAATFPEVIGELHIDNGWSGPSALDPKRPPQDPTVSLDRIASELALVRGALSSADGSEIKTDAIAEAKIDVWRDQIGDGNGAAVVGALRSFIAGFSAPTDAHVRFRAHANLGAALAQMGQFELADFEFVAAAQAEPGTAASHAYLARVAMSRLDPDSASQEANAALVLDPKQALAAVMLVESVREEGLNDELEKKLGELIRGDAGSALSSRYSKAKRHEDALRVARQLDAPAQRHDLIRNTAIAEAILHRFDDDFGVRLGAPPQSRRTGSS